MEFTFSLNTIFPSELGDIVKVGQDLVPVGSTSVVRNMFYHVRQRVGEIIDVMGEASATAQNLRGPITSGNKLKSHGDHIVYLLVERVSETGRGAVVGLLKIGKKRLVLSNRFDLQATCILKMGQPLPLFVYFRSYNNNLTEKNCRLWSYLNSDCLISRQAY